jgi:hypothetical protein
MSEQPGEPQPSPEVQMLLRIETLLLANHQVLKSINSAMTFFVVVTILGLVLGGCNVLLSFGQ